jgi:uncharacterized membrane protein (UPF0127 family)
MSLKKTTYYWIILGIVLALTTGILLYNQQQTPIASDPTIQEYTTANISFTDSTVPSLEVWIADTPYKRSKGLSVVDTLNENEGMFFIFEQPGIYPFWMKDMQFPIDIMWIDASMRIVYIHEDAVPEDYPSSYNPRQEALYVLETASGFVEKYGIAIGDTVIKE